MSDNNESTASAQPRAWLFGADAQLLARARACFPGLDWRHPPDKNEQPRRSGLFGRTAPLEPWTARVGADDIFVVADGAKAPPATLPAMMALGPLPFGREDPDLSLRVDGLRLQSLRGFPAREPGVKGLPTFLLSTGGQTRSGVVVVGGPELLTQARDAFPESPLSAILRPAATPDQLFEAEADGAVLREPSCLPELLAGAERVVTDILEIALAARAAGAEVVAQGASEARFEMLSEDGDGGQIDTQAWYGFVDPDTGASLPLDAAMQAWRIACGAPRRAFLLDNAVPLDTARLCFPTLDWRAPGIDAPTPSDWIIAGDEAALAGVGTPVAGRLTIGLTPFEGVLPHGAVGLSLRSVDGARPPEFRELAGLPRHSNDSARREGVFVAGTAAAIVAARARFPRARLRFVLRGAPSFADLVALSKTGGEPTAPQDAANAIARAATVVGDSAAFVFAAAMRGAQVEAEGEAAIWSGRLIVDESGRIDADTCYGFADVQTQESLQPDAIADAALATLARAAADAPPSFATLRDVMIGQPGRAIVPFTRHLGEHAWQKPGHLKPADFAAVREALAHCDISIYARDAALPEWIAAAGRTHWVVDREPIDYPLMLTTSTVFIPTFHRLRVRLDGPVAVYAPEDEIAFWNAEARARHLAFGRVIAPRLRRLQTARRLARFNKVEIGRRFGPLSAERVLVLGEETEGSKHLQSNPNKVKDIDVLRLALAERPNARILYAPQRKTLANEASLKAVRALGSRVHIVDQAYCVGEFAHVVDEVRTIDNLQGALAIAIGLPVIVHGRPPYAGLGVTRDIGPDGADQPPRLAEPLDHDTFLGWYFGTCLLFADPLDGTPMSIGTYLDAWTPYLGELSDAVAGRIVALACDPGQTSADRTQFLRALAAHAKDDHIAKLVDCIGHPEIVDGQLDLASDIAIDVARRGDWRGGVDRVRAIWAKHSTTSSKKLFDLLVSIRRCAQSTADGRAMPNYVLSQFRNLSSAQVKELGDTFAAAHFYGAALTIYASCQDSIDVRRARARCLVAIGDLGPAQEILDALREAKAPIEELEIALAERRGDADKVLELLKARAMAVPADVNRQLALANAYRESGRADEAHAIFMRLLRSKHGSTAARALGQIHVSRMETAAASGFIDAQLRQLPTDAAALRVKADILSFENDLSGTCDALLSLLKLSPLNIGAHTQLMELEAEMGVVEPDGLGPGTRAFLAFLDDIDQPTVETLMAQGRARLQQHDFETLKRNCLTVMRLFPTDVGAHAWHAHALAWEPGEKSAETLATISAQYDLALARERDDNAWMMLDSIRSAAHLGDVSTIRRMTRENRFSLYVGDREKLVIPRYSAAMALGDFAGAFDAMRSFNRTRILRRHARPFRLALTLADIGPRQKTLLVSEGGVGDEIRYSLLYPEIAQRLHDVSISVDRRLHTLFERSFPMIKQFVPLPRYDRKRLSSEIIDEIDELPDRELAPFFNNDAWRVACGSEVVAPIPCLLADLRRTESDFRHAHSVRLRPRPDLVEFWRDRLAPYADRLIVGATWTSMMRQYQRVGNYLTHEEMAPIFTTPGAVFVNCQYEPVEEELRWAREALGVEIVDFPDLDKRDDFEGLAALIANLDVFVGTGTTTTELAALVGCPTIYASPANMNAYRNPDFTETDLYFNNITMVRPIPVSDRASMVRRIEKLLLEAVAAKASQGTPNSDQADAPLSMQTSSPVRDETPTLVAPPVASHAHGHPGSARRRRR